MCICFFALDAFPKHQDLAFLLLFGRDEFLSRPTAPTHRWPDEPLVLAGRDMQAQGTWLGVTPTGRVAFLTNLRERDPDPDPSDGPSRHASRGGLTTGFLLGKQRPLEYLQAIPRDLYHGFNLVVADLTTGEMAYTANPFEQPKDLKLLPATTSVTPMSASGLATPVEAAAEKLAVTQGTGCKAGQQQQQQQEAGSAGSLDAGRQGVAGGDSCQLDMAGASSGLQAWQTEPRLRRLVRGGPLVLDKGCVYGLSNGLLNEWPKVQGGIRDLQRCMGAQVDAVNNAAAATAATAATTATATGIAAAVGGVAAAAATEAADAAAGKVDGCQPSQPSGNHAGEDDRALPWNDLFERVLGNRSKDEALKQDTPTPSALGGRTGLESNVEYVCSSRFIDVADFGQLGTYGTRSQTVLAVWKDGQAEMRERSLDTASMQWKEETHRFAVTSQKGVLADDSSGVAC